MDAIHYEEGHDSQNEILEFNKEQEQLHVGYDSLISTKTEKNYSTDDESEDWQDAIVVSEDWTLEAAEEFPNSNSEKKSSSNSSKPKLMSNCGQSTRDLRHGATQLVLIPSSNYIMENLELFHAMCSIEELEFFKMEKEMQEELMKTVVIETFGLNEYIIHEGDSGSDFFFIVTPYLDKDGMAAAEVIKNNKTVTRLFCGQIFGEKNFLTNAGTRKRNASVRVVGQFNRIMMGMTVLGRNKYGEIYDSHSNVEYTREPDEQIAIARVSPQHFQKWRQLRENMIMALIPAFQHFSKNNFSKMLLLCNLEHFTHGDFLMREGELGDKVYFVLDGKLVVFKAVFGEIVKLHPGHCIGEMAVIFNTRRYASVMCMEQTTCLSLTREAFQAACLMENGFKIFVSDILNKREEMRTRREALAVRRFPLAIISDKQQSPRSPSNPAHTPTSPSRTVVPRSLFPESPKADSLNSSTECCYNYGSSGSNAPSQIQSRSRSQSKSHSQCGACSQMCPCTPQLASGTPENWSPKIPTTPFMCQTPKFNKGDGDTAVTITKTLTSHKTREGQKVLNDKYTIISSIGKGSFGEVFKVIDPSHVIYAMKCLNRSQLSRMETSTLSVQKEIEIMSKLRHPNVVALYEVIDSQKDKIYLIQEFMQSTLMSLPEKGSNFPVKPLEQELCRQYFRDIIRGVSYLHSQGVVHRDIKPQNIFISTNGVAKIGDFGASIFTGGLTRSAYQGTPAFTAPELSIPKEWSEYNFNSMPTIDIFAMGVTLYCMSTGDLPWVARTQVSLAAKIMNLEPRFPSVIDIHLKHLLKRMLDKEWSSRVTIPEIEVDDWVTREGTEPLYQESMLDDYLEKENKFPFTEEMESSKSSTNMSPQERFLRLPNVGGTLNLEMALTEMKEISNSTGNSNESEDENIQEPKAQTFIVLVSDANVFVELMNSDECESAENGGDRTQQNYVTRTKNATKVSLTDYVTKERPASLIRSEILTMNRDENSLGISTLPEGEEWQNVEKISGSISGVDSDSTSITDADEVQSFSGDDLMEEFDHLIEISSTMRANTLSKAEWDHCIEYPEGLPPHFWSLNTAPQGSFRGKLVNLKLRSRNFENSRLRIRVGLCLEKGTRDTMEDFVLCAANSHVPTMVKQCGFEDLAIMAVFDGHGDSGSIAEQLSDRTESVLLNSLEYECTTNPSGDSLVKLRSALNKTVARLELETLWHVQQKVKGATNPFQAQTSRFGGSTAAILTISNIAGRLHMMGCWVGDSTAILSKNGTAIALSRDHRVKTNSNERERVLAAGGEILNDRLFGDLQLSRSIGDISYKKTVEQSDMDMLSSQKSYTYLNRKILQMWAQDEIVISKPEFWSLDLDSPDHEFVILGTDGLFDLVTHQEAVNFARFWLLKNQSLHVTASMLANLAAQRAQGVADNIGLIIVALHQVDNPPATL